MERKNKFVYTANQEILYWMTLLILVIATLVVSVVLVPLLLVMEPIPLYALLILLGVTFGSVFALLIRDIEGLKTHHHVLALIFLPTISILALLVITTITSKAASMLMIQMQTNPIIAAVVYAVALLLPYLMTRNKKL